MEQATKLAYQLLELAEETKKVEQLHSAYSAIIVSETYNGQIYVAIEFLDKIKGRITPIQNAIWLLVTDFLHSSSV
ncbi:MAG: hypothetical protein U5K54_09325 [Cytophagales bacterium]|nr:hypothetical protein [Cytophagales bacterium]